MCPPEDCGGPHGYAEFLRAIKKPGSPRGGELLEWVGGAFDRHGFELAEVAFDDPEARWAWTFDEAAFLENEVHVMQAAPRKPDRAGRVAFHIPLTPYEKILQYSEGLDADVLEQWSAASRKNGAATVKLDPDELKALGGHLALAAKNLRKLDRRILAALREHFQWMESCVRRNGN
jgi:hypothetical protein